MSVLADAGPGSSLSVDTDVTNRLGSLLLDVVARTDWQSRVRFNVDRRWYGRLPLDGLVAGAPVEAWLLSWWPGQETGLHDHGGAAGAFAVVRGQLREDTPHWSAEAAPRLRQRRLTVGQHRVFGPRHLHQVVNDGDIPAVSIHVYAPRLTTMTRYEWTDDGPAVLAVERSGRDW